MPHEWSNWSGSVECQPRQLLLPENEAEVVAVVHGTVEGLIIEKAQGRNGFGYDPHFLVPALNLTTAQMPPQQKNKISHRGQALRRIVPIIREHVLRHTQRKG